MNGMAAQIDEIYGPQPGMQLRAPQTFLIDRKYKTANRTVIVETGLDEAPKVEITTTGAKSSDALVDQIRAAANKFTELKALQPGWDSYNAPRVAKSAIRPAMEATLFAIHQCKEPRVEASSDGGIDLIWEDQERHLSMTVEPSGSFEILLVTNGQDFDEPPYPSTLEVAKSYIARF